MPPSVDLNALGRLTPNRVIVFREKNKRIAFENAQAVTVREVHLDNEALPPDFGPRCDGVLVCPAEVPNHEHYVELKGSDVGHAVEQLRNSLQKLSRDVARQPKSCYVISSRVPRAGTDIQRFQRQFHRQYVSMLYVRSREMTVAL
jgi:hypothetical protein